jgi:hypothetical protein
LDASGGSVFLNLIRPAMLDSIRAAASTQQLDASYGNARTVIIKTSFMRSSIQFDEIDIHHSKMLNI